MNEVNLNSLKLFMEVATSNSFLEAANKLNISQPAISKSIFKLEDDLNVKLFYRENTGIVLTKSGQILLEYLKKAKNILASCERKLSSVNDIENSKIVIGIQSHIARNYILDKIKKFKKKYPNIKIEIVDMPTTTMLDNLIDKKLDFIIDSLPIENNYKNINIRKIKEFDTCFISNDKNININIKTIDDLNTLSLIMPSQGSNIRRNINNYFKDYKIILNPLFEFDTEELIIDAVKKGFGVGYIIEPNNIDELKDNRLFKLNTNYNLPKVEIALVTVDSNLNCITEMFIKEEIAKEE